MVLERVLPFMKHPLDEGAPSLIARYELFCMDDEEVIAE